MHGVRKCTYTYNYTYTMTTIKFMFAEKYIAKQHDKKIEKQYKHNLNNTYIYISVKTQTCRR